MPLFTEDGDSGMNRPTPRNLEGRNFFLKKCFDGESDEPTKRDPKDKATLRRRERDRHADGRPGSCLPGETTPGDFQARPEVDGLQQEG